MGRKEMLFEGPDNNRLPRHNTMAVNDRLFYYIGQLIALSLLNCGPCIQWLAPTIVNYIFGEDESVYIEDIPKPDVAKVRMVSYIHLKLPLDS